MLEGEDHVQLLPFRICIEKSVLNSCSCSLPDCEPVVSGYDLPVHLLQELMDPGAIVGIWRRVSIFSSLDAIREVLVLAYHGDHVHPEAVDTLVSPVSHHLIDSIPYINIFPVQVRLLNGKGVEIVFSPLFVPLPGRASEAGSPVVLLLPPDVPVCLVVIPGG